MHISLWLNLTCINALEKQFECKDLSEHSNMKGSNDDYWLSHLFALKGNLFQEYKQSNSRKIQGVLPYISYWFKVFPLFNFFKNHLLKVENIILPQTSDKFCICVVYIVYYILHSNQN